MGEAKVADVITIQDLVDGRLDVKGMATFYNGAAGLKVPRRLAGDIETLEFYLEYMRGLQAVYEQPSGMVEVNGVQVKPVKVALKEALDAAVVGGGGLADTAVATVPQLTAAIARTQASKNNDIVSIKDFGDFADGADWTSAFQKAVATGKSIYLPKGKYQLSKNNYSCQGKDLILYSDGAEVELIGTGFNKYAFEVSNCKNVIIRGITFKSGIDEVRNLLSCSPTSYIEYFSVTKSKFEGTFCLIRSPLNGSTTQDPTVTPFGFKRLIYNDNEALNMEAYHIVLTNYPIWDMEFCRNRIHNFSYVYFYGGITNGAANEQKLFKIGSKVFDSNIVTNDDTYISKSTDAYYAVIVDEGFSCEWTNNKVSGMKSNVAGVVLYDAYLNSKNVTSTGNTYKNNAKIGATDNPPHFIMSKTFSNDIKATKTFTGNNYIIERDWLARVGATTCVHSLHNLGTESAGYVTIKNNVFVFDKMYPLIRHAADNYKFSDNNITANSVFNYGGSLLSCVPTVEGVSELEVNNNTFNILDNTELSLSFIRGGVSNPAFWGKANIHNNTINFKNTYVNGNFFLDMFGANSAYITNNNMNVGLSTAYNRTVFKKLTASNNNYVGARAAGARYMVGFSVCENSSIKDSFYGLAYPDGFVHKVHTDSLTVPITANTIYNLDVAVSSKLGKGVISLSYTLGYSAGVYTVTFLNKALEVVTAQALTSASNIVEVNFTASGTLPTLLKVVFNNSSAFTGFAIANTPNYECRYEANLSVYSN